MIELICIPLLIAIFLILGYAVGYWEASKYYSHPTGRKDD